MSKLKWKTFKLMGCNENAVRLHQSQVNRNCFTALPNKTGFRVTDLSIVHSVIWNKTGIIMKTLNVLVWLKCTPTKNIWLDILQDTRFPWKAKNRVSVPLRDIGETWKLFFSWVPWLCFLIFHEGYQYTRKNLFKKKIKWTAFFILF